MKMFSLRVINPFYLWTRLQITTSWKVKAFAGYFNNKKGELMAFSIIANQFEGSESGMSRELVKLFEDMWSLE